MLEVLNLNENNCADCYKCIRTCSVKAITYANNTAEIVHDECILCGNCFVACPQKAKQVRNDVPRVKEAIAAGKHVVCSLAPSFIADFRIRSLDVMTDALKRLGFAEVQETAVGAQMVSDEYARIMREGKQRVLISSCCPSINMLIQKYYPTMLPHLAKVLTPMQAHCKDIKQRYSGAKTVFIGPCVAKKDEADYYTGITDAVLTYEELTEWFEAAGIVPEKKLDKTEESLARFFPTTGGILKTMQKNMRPDYTYLAVDGVENCMAALHDIEEGNLERCFIEMSACAGSCIGGPVMEKYHRMPVRDYYAVAHYAGKKDFNVAQPDPFTLRKEMEYIGRKLPYPSESEIREALRRMGKLRPEDELNCGSCGYNTCREKAVAIIQGKAEVSMCLPFLKERAENFSDNIINNTPNGIVVLNDKYEVQQINRAALKLMNIPRESDVMGEPIIRILDPKPFMDVQRTGRTVRDEKVYLAEYDKYIEQTIVLDKEYKALICIMRDVSDEEQQRQRKEELGRQTVETADKVVDKQMRIVQEIASLLGETAAETKIALTKLKESMTDE